MLGKSLAGRSSQVSACRRLVGQGSAEIVALSLGSSGALVVTKDRAWLEMSPFE